eukprot:9675523-Alexandrium_andersonii.AAC.1
MQTRPLPLRHTRSPRKGAGRQTPPQVQATQKISGCTGSCLLPVVRGQFTGLGARPSSPGTIGHDRPVVRCIP